MKPPRSILDKKFIYVPSAQTDIRKTFQRLQRAQRQPAPQQAKTTNVAIWPGKKVSV